MRDYWENLYNKNKSDDGLGPDIFFRTFIEGVQPGRILLPAEGVARNAAYAASMGWEVNVFDFSLTARRNALEQARKKGIKIDYFEPDIEFHQLEAEMYDAIALMHVQFHPHNRTYIHRKLINSLKTGGFFIIEAYSKSRSPVSQGIQAYESADLQYDFKDLHIETLYRAVTDFNEDIPESERPGVIRMVALKQ
jgi:SAM-dependent methyltransferase